MSSTFKRNVEDFSCEKCGTKVVGTGYTNHCPNCLWSKHVDVTPGDRASQCGGMMEPIGTFIQRGEQAINHRCVKCGHEKVNRTAKDDNFDKLIEIASIEYEQVAKIH